MYQLRTERLVLRQWREEDLPSFAQLNADPVVMEYFPEALSSAESNRLALRLRRSLRMQGWGVWVVEGQLDGRFIGVVGLQETKFALPVSPCVEVAWRLGSKHWGKGYATEAARAVLELAFTSLGIPQVCAFTTVLNKRSEAVMQRLNMSNTEMNFHHPRLPQDSPLREHVLYIITRENWEGLHRD